MHLFNLGSWSWLFGTLYELSLVICNFIYSMIAWLYKVFIAVAKVNLFDRKTFDDITSRIYIVIGIAVLFIFAYNLILMIINPDDKKGTGAMTKVIKETIISLVLVVLLPTIFNYLYIFQNHILDSQIITQIILGPVGSTSGQTTNCEENDYDCSCKFTDYTPLDKYIGKGKQTRSVKTELGDLCMSYKGLESHERGAYAVPITLMSAFYKPLNFTFEECVSYIQGDPGVITDTEEQQICANYFYDVTAAKYAGDISPFIMDEYLRNIVSEPTKSSLELNAVFAILAGVLAVWMFFCYAMEIGVRVAKLGVLQLISPIPVLLRVIPKQKEGIYNKWFNKLKDTYLDVFIRLIIIYFSLFAVSLVPNVLNSLLSGLSKTKGGASVKILASAFVILGILKFAQEAPALIKEFFGNSGKFSVKPKDVFNSPGINAVRAGVYGASTGKGMGRFGGFFSGMARGAVGGYDKAVKGIDTARTERANGSTFGGRMLDRARVISGMETRGEREERNLEKKFHTKDRTELNSNIQKEIDTIKNTVDSKLEQEHSNYKFDIKDENGNTFSYKGVSLTGLNYAGYQKYIAAVQKDMEKETDLQKRKEMQKQILDMTTALENSKKDATKEIVTKAFRGDDSRKLLNAADLEKINSAKNKINIDIQENSVGIVYDENGKKTTITNSNGKKIDSVWKDEITDGEQLFGKDSLRDRLTTQRENISLRASQIQSGNYGKYQADSRMVRGQGRSEKK